MTSSLYRCVGLALLALCGFVAGAYSAIALTSSSKYIPGVVSSGPWRTSVYIGSSDADPWTRAIIARIGLLALPRSEAIYFSATVDSDGEPLRSDARYIIDGPVPDASWWSITAYGADNYLMASSENRYSVSSSEFEGISFKAQVTNGFGPFDGPTITTSGNQNITLVLRLYNPPLWKKYEIEKVSLPEIRRASDEE